MHSDDNSIPEDWPPFVSVNNGRKALYQLGRIVPTAEWMKKLLVDAGFVDVQVKTLKHPLGTWPKNPDLKQAGALFTMASETTYHAYNMSLFTRVLGWDTEKADALCTASHKAHLERKSGVHAYTLL